MLNLLFISDSPKAEHIKRVLQPVLKVIIDVVTDFDHGLRDVFEKRPATVCIQYQIGSVTGESVARHIQMLLGASAPKFILLYTENDKPKAIKGLYEHLIDLNQPNDALAENVIATLKLLLGDQWEKICIQPAAPAASDELSAAEPTELPVKTDTLGDDSLSKPAPTDFFEIENNSTGVSTLQNISNESATAGPPGNMSAPAVPANLNLSKERKKKPVSPESLSDSIVPVKTGAKTASPPPASLPPSPQKSQPTPAPAEFRISNTPIQEEEPLPEGLLLAFEENYRSKSPSLQGSVVVLLFIVISAAGGWYLFKQKPQMLSVLKQRIMSIAGAKTAPVAESVPAIVAPAPLPPPVPQPTAKPALPTFIPKDGYDSSYASTKPGWERYVGKNEEFRVFIDSGRIKAVQVVSLKNASLSDTLISSVLQELVGTTKYSDITRTTKAGVQVENGKIENKGEVLIYRKNRSVKAFVVSIN